MPLDLRGWLRDAAGLPVSGASVVAYASGTLGFPTTTVTATMSTEGSQGRWDFPSLADGIYDLSFTSGTQVRWIKGGESRQYYDAAIQRLLQLPDGVAGVPALAFSKDPDTGLYRVGANNPAIAVGGTKLLDLLATGLGVGVAPSARQHVQESTVGNEVERVESVATNDNPTRKVFQARGVTVSSALVSLFEYTVIPSTTVGIRARVVARRTAGGGAVEDGGYFDLVATFKVNSSGGITQIGATTTLVEVNDQAVWAVYITVNAGRIMVSIWSASGLPYVSVTWHGTIEIYEVNS